MKAAASLDDLYAYCVGENNYLLIINASRIEEDVSWMLSKWGTFARRDEVQIKNISDTYGAIAAQGPKVALSLTTYSRGKPWLVFREMR